MTELYAPIITSTETWNTWDEEWYPAGPRNFAKRARGYGWDARIGFSRGYVVGQAVNSWELRDIIGVWIDGWGGKRAGALWERNPDAEFTARKLESGVKPGEIPSGMQWKSSGTMIMIAKGRAFPYASLTKLDEWVSQLGAVSPAWYIDLRDAVVHAREHAAQVARDKADREKKARADAAHESAISATL